MKIFSIHPRKVQTLPEDILFILLESQPFGADEDLRLVIGVKDADAHKVAHHTGTGSQKDKGRSVGYWQNYRGNGVYEVSKVNTTTMPNLQPRTIGAIALKRPANISVTGRTWSSIIKKSPNSEQICKDFSIRSRGK